MSIDWQIHKMNRPPTLCDDCGSVIQIKGIVNGKDTSMWVITTGYNGTTPITKGICVDCYRRYCKERQGKDDQERIQISNSL